MFFALVLFSAVSVHAKSVAWVRLQDRVQTMGDIQLEGSACNYTVHKGNNITEIAEDVQVGDHIYHRVNCDIPDLDFNSTSALDQSNGTTVLDESKYCLIVFNCTLSNWDRSDSYRLLDEDGCSMEPSLIEHPEYPEDMEAGIRAQAIRFIGDPTHTTSVFMMCNARRVPKGKRGTCDDRRPRCKNNEYLFRHK